MRNFNLFGSRVSRKFKFFCAAAFWNYVPWDCEGERAHVWVWNTTKLLKFLHKWFFDKVLVQAVAWAGDFGGIRGVSTEHNRLHERLAHTHAVPPWSDLIDVEHTYIRHQQPPHIVQCRENCWDCNVSDGIGFFFFLASLKTIFWHDRLLQPLRDYSVWSVATYVSIEFRSLRPKLALTRKR